MASLGIREGALWAARLAAWANGRIQNQSVLIIIIRRAREQESICHRASGRATPFSSSFRFLYASRGDAISFIPCVCRLVLQDETPDRDKTPTPCAAPDVHDRSPPQKTHPWIPAYPTFHCSVLSSTHGRDTWGPSPSCMVQKSIGSQTTEPHCRRNQFSKSRRGAGSLIVDARSGQDIRNPSK